MSAPRREFSLGLLVLLAGCGLSTPSVTEPPPQIHGGWMRDSLKEITAAELPESIREVRAEKMWQASYRGPRDITGIWIRYPNETVVFEAFQRFRKTPEIRAFRRGPYLVLLRTADVPVQKLGDFEEGVAKAIN